MKPHGRAHRVEHMSEQARASSEVPPEEPVSPGTFLGRGYSESGPPRRSLGRGNLLRLGESSVLISGRSALSHKHEESVACSIESDIENISKEFHEMHVEKRQDVPVPTEGHAPTPRRTSTEKTAQSTRRVEREKAASTAGRAPTEKAVPTARRAPTEKGAPTARRAPTEKGAQSARRAQTAKGAQSARRAQVEKAAQSEKPLGRERIALSPERQDSTENITSAAASCLSPESVASTAVGQTSAEKTEPTSDKSVEKARPVTLLTNYVKLEIDPNVPMFEYEVTFTPDVEFINFRYKLLYEHFHGRKDILCYDGNLKLFTPERVTDSIQEFIVYHPIDESVVVMSIKLKKKAEGKDCIVIFNTLFHNCSRILRLTRFGNKYFNAEAAIDIPQHKLEIWPGYVTSIDDFDGGIQLRCDVNHRVLRTETVLDVLTVLGGRGPEYLRALALRDLIGQCVLTRYNNNLYRIDDIDWSKTPLSTFTLGNGEEISYIQYYKRQYNLDITDEKQPLLINMSNNGRYGKRSLICLVPEICHMTGLNDKMRKDIKVMKDIARYTRITPSQRIYAFKKFLENMRNNTDVQNLLKKWGVKIVNDLVQLKGKNLEPETLVFGNHETLKPFNYDWMKSLRNLNVYRAVNINRWIILYPSRNFRIAEDFMGIIKKIGPGLGIVIEDPKKVALRDDRIETYINGLRTNIKGDTQIVVCICPTAREDRYNAIKKFCCKEVPVPSQVVNMITLSREERMRAVVQNIALQMNHKIGGAGWAIQLPLNRIMVCGVDAYHDKSHSTGSIGALVASTNNDYTEWFSRTNFQGPKQELISGIVDAFTSALSAYSGKNNGLPDRIVVFRDGVSDGQLDTCLHYEVPQFLKAFKIVKNDYNPEFVYIIVQKRISTKLYKMGDQEVENPTPGGVVDNVITKKGALDFYLVSQLVRSGTASPTHYIVLYDNSNSSPDYLQRLTYKFCHLYYNWPGTIRVPAPCQYAHKLAYLVGQNIKCMPDESLENKLFYL